MTPRKLAVTVAVIALAAITTLSAVLWTTSTNAATPKAAVSEMILPIAGGVDGDTIKTRLDALPCPLCRVSIRIRGIDTPEKGHRAKCVKEVALAVRASQLTTDLIGTTRTMSVRNFEWDKYGGRIDGDVVINGHDVAKELMAAGLARPYTGKGPKPDWCAP